MHCGGGVGLGTRPLRAALNTRKNYDKKFRNSVPLETDTQTLKMSSVFDLVESGSREELLERLDGDGWDPKERDKHGRTALDLAVVLGRVELTNLLLEKGSDVNLTNSSS